MKCRRFLWVCLVLAAASVAARASAGSAEPLLIVSMDAFRWDYCDLHPAQTPNLRRLKAEGASARVLISVFPSNTFPNHYTLVTGLWPEHHGILNNTMYDASTQNFFHYNKLSEEQQPQWWRGEPIWVTAIKQGRRAACSFWVGSDVEIEGVRPDAWRPYDESVPFEQRLEDLTHWMQAPPAQRPDVVTFYLEETNSVAHAHGPDAPETVAAIQLLDTRVGAILARLGKLGVEPNVVVVSDHGMTEVRPERCVALDDFIDLGTVQIDFWGPVAGLRPRSGTVDALLARLQHLPAGAKAYRAEDLPKRFHVGKNPRTPPVWILPAEGGSVGTRASLTPWLKKTRGEHGYDPTLADMGGVLIVHGPAFVHDGRVIDRVENVNLYNMFCAVAHLRPAPNDGDDRLVRELVRRERQ